MTANTDGPVGSPPAQRDVSLRQILMALAGPLVWAIHFMLTYLAAEGACRLGALGGPWLGLTGLGWYALVTTVLALGLTLWAGLSAYRRWREARDEPAEPLGARPPSLLALGGWALSLLFSALIVLSLIPLVVLRPCAWN